MATLTGKKIKNTYKDLLQVSNSNAGIDSTLRTISDGEATDSVLQLSSSAVNISSAGALQYAGTAITSTAAELNYLDGADSSITTLSLPDNTTITAFGASLIDDADAATARTTLGVDAAGTDNSTDVTLVTTSHDYLSLSGQAITLGTIDISDDTNLVGGTGITLTGDTLSTTDSEIVHDSLSGFVSNEHVDHSSVTLTAGNGLSGGGDLTASRSFALDLNELTTETTIADADFIAMVDATDNGSGKITFENLEDAIFSSVSGDIAIAEDGVATIQANSVALGTDTTGNYVASLTEGSLIDLQNNSGEGATPTIDVDLTESAATSIANGDYVIFLDGGSTGSHAKGDIADIATLFAGTGLTASNSVIGVDAAQTQITQVGTLSVGAISSGFGAIDIGSDNLTATGTISLGATSFNDNNITNVGDIALDSLSADGSTINLAITDNTSDAFTIKQSTNKYLAINTTDAGENISIGTGVSGTSISIGHSTSETTVNDNLTVTGDLTVNGSTVTVNTTTVTIDDPVFTLGGDTAPASDDNKDRGIEFRWHNGSAAKVGFFGYDDSAEVFTFIQDATNTSEVFSGSAGNVAFGNIAGTLTTASQTNITGVGALNAGSITSGFGAIDNGSSNITTTGTISFGSLLMVL